MKAITLELCQARLDRFDPEATVAMLAERGFDTIVCFALGYAHGETYYPSKLADPHPELGGRDLLGDVMRASHAHGLQAFAYVNALFGGPQHAVPHPDWCQRTLDGSLTMQGDATAMCPLSPYGEHIAGVVTEIARAYEIDGLYLDEPSFQSWCACGFCRGRHLAVTGREIPVATAFGDPEFGAWLDWRSSEIASFVGRVGEALRAVRPGATFMAQHAFPLAATDAGDVWGSASSRVPAEFAGWYRPTFYAQDIGLVAEQLDVVAIEPWRRIAAMPPWWPGACVSYARSAGHGRPVLPLLEYPHFPWSLTALGASELSAEAVDAIASGGGVWYAMYALDDADPAGWDALGATLAELDGAPQGGEQVSYVGVLASRRSAERYGASASESRVLDDIVGTVGIVRSLQLPYALLAAEALTAEALAACAVVIVPSAACLGEREVELLTAYVEGGGGVIVFGPAGTHDSDGRPRGGALLDELCGATTGEPIDAGTSYATVRDTALGWPAGHQIPLLGAVPAREPRDARVLATLTPAGDMFALPEGDSGVPVITSARRGEGVAVHVGPAWGRLWLRSGITQGHALLDRLISHAAAVPPPFTVDADRGVGVHAWRADAGLAIWLVNLTGVAEHGTVSRVGPVRHLAPRSNRRDRAARREHRPSDRWQPDRRAAVPARVGVRARQSLTAPAARPPTRRRWISTVRIAIGTIAIDEAAASGPQSPTRLPTNALIATGSVRAWVAVSTTGIRNSFQASSATKMLVAAKPGAASGTTTLQSVRRRPAPSMAAACSSSSGIVAMNDVISQAAKGTLIAA